MRGAIAARTLGVFERYVDEMYRHMWVDHKKLDDPAVLAAAFTESGFDAQRLIAAAATPAVKSELIANTERAVERGAFGSPTFFVDDEMWFGKDRLDEVEQAILRKQAGISVATARLPAVFFGHGSPMNALLAKSLHAGMGAVWRSARRAHAAFSASRRTGTRAARR